MAVALAADGGGMALRDGLSEDDNDAAHQRPLGCPSEAACQEILFYLKIQHVFPSILVHQLDACHIFLEHLQSTE